MRIFFRETFSPFIRHSAIAVLFLTGFSSFASAASFNPVLDSTHPDLEDELQLIILDAAEIDKIITGPTSPSAEALNEWKKRKKLYNNCADCMADQEFPED